MKIETYDDAIRKNRKAILAALSKIEATNVEVCYSGSGDSGQVDGVSILRDEETIDASQVMIDFEEEKSHHNHETKQWERIVSTEPKSLPDAIESLCYDLLEREHGGWENNEGADGLFTFDVKEGKIKWSHNEFYTETNTTEHEY